MEIIQIRNEDRNKVIHSKITFNNEEEVFLQILKMNRQRVMAEIE